MMHYNFVGAVDDEANAKDHVLALRLRAGCLVAGLSGVTAVAAGVSHTLALKRDGTLWVWGCNSSRRLGIDGAPK